MSSNLKFRGKSAVRSAYITVTGSTYGKGNVFSAAALTRHVAMKKYSPEAVYQAITRLESEGVIEFTGKTVKNQTGRGARKYLVLTERDNEIAQLTTTGKPRAKRRAPRAKVEVESVPESSLEDRVAKLEATIAALGAAFRSA